MQIIGYIFLGLFILVLVVIAVNQTIGLVKDIKKAKARKKNKEIEISRKE